jgi:hypothetical protein
VAGGAVLRRLLRGGGSSWFSKDRKRGWISKVESSGGGSKLSKLEQREAPQEGRWKWVRFLLPLPSLHPS